MELERENRESRHANKILREASAYFAPPLSECVHLPAAQRAERDRRFTE